MSNDASIGDARDLDTERPETYSCPAEDGQELQDGMRIGRYLVLRDAEGRQLAIAAHAVAAASALDDGTLLMLPAGKLAVVPHPFARVVGWLAALR
ncbi:hypothetical protein [Falsiroseomonas oryzae]|uniref:hypothetical protein n=1 Tax=Falsiroseomonas oryzae TaxID=2766473 RepID=UPI0022EAD782|nr:hypothetical protein [Roseomonas sp. MO-31]